MERRVCIRRCPDYDVAKIQKLLHQQFLELEVEKLVKPGCSVVVKPNLVLKSRPEAAIVTHPAVVSAVALEMMEFGAGRVTVAESPGGLHNLALLQAIYGAAGYGKAAKDHGFFLNQDTSSRWLEVENGKACHGFDVITPILEADLVVDVAKLKTHCMMNLSAGVKNMFGVVPGLKKPELHCRFPDRQVFGQMVADLCLAVKPALTVVDGILAMEGNGPSGGNPRKMDMLVASRNPFAADFLCAWVIQQAPESIPYLKSGMDRGACPRSFSQLMVAGDDPASFMAKDFCQPASKSTDLIQRLPAVFQKPAQKLLTPRPKIRPRDCVGCGKCVESCPQHTIKLVGKKAVIAYGPCIRCYCCQELCPNRAIDIKGFQLFRL